jgi:hypothetical protein
LQQLLRLQLPQQAARLTAQAAAKQEGMQQLCSLQVRQTQPPTAALSILAAQHQLLQLE